MEATVSLVMTAATRPVPFSKTNPLYMPEDSTTPQTHPQPQKPALPLHEWLAVAAIMGFMITLTAITAFKDNSAPYATLADPHYITDPNIEICMEGEVEHKGALRVNRGATIREVIDIAKPTPHADLSKLKMASKVRKGQIVKVPKLVVFTIYLEGAVKQPGALKVPKGTRLEDLQTLVAFAPEAKIDVLQKKRRLKDGEIIRIPARSPRK